MQYGGPLGSPSVAAERRGQADGDRRFDWIMAGLSIWWMVGLFVDGWAHSNLARLETFFTPWHALLYSGFAAVAVALGLRTLANLRAMEPRPSPATVLRDSLRDRRLPQAGAGGFELSLLGGVVFTGRGGPVPRLHPGFGDEGTADRVVRPPPPCPA